MEHLIWAAAMAHPEIANIVWNLARFCVNPGKVYYGKSAENIM